MARAGSGRRRPATIDDRRLIALLGARAFFYSVARSIDDQVTTSADFFRRQWRQLQPMMSGETIVRSTLDDRWIESVTFDSPALIRWALATYIIAGNRHRTTAIVVVQAITPRWFTTASLWSWYCKYTDAYVIRTWQKSSVKCGFVNKWNVLAS